MTASPAPRPHRPQQKNTPRRPKEGGRGAAAQRWRTYGGTACPRSARWGRPLRRTAFAHSAIPAQKRARPGRSVDQAVISSRSFGSRCTHPWRDGAHGIPPGSCPKSSSCRSRSGAHRTGRCRKCSGWHVPFLVSSFLRPSRPGARRPWPGAVVVLHAAGAAVQRPTPYIHQYAPRKRGIYHCFL